jgi:glycerophosphoryl diester phosphodiesterase
VLEVDVRQTKDGHLVLMHDASVDRTTDGEGDVAELTLEQLKRLDGGSWFGEAFNHERIPTLTEAIDLLPDSIQIIIEIKGDSSTYPDIEKKVVALVKARRIESRVILKSFDAEVLDHLRRLAPDIRRLFVYAVRVPLLDVVIGTGLSRVDVFSLPVRYLQPHSLFVTGSFVEDARARGVGVIAWDVHDEYDMKELIRTGVAGIETDYPDVLRRVVTALEAIGK